MRVEARHLFDATPSAVAGVLADPGFHSGLELPDVRLADVLDHRHEGGVTVVRLRYEFTGHLDPVGRRLLGNRRLSWDQELSVDVRDATGTLSIAAAANAALLHGRARFVIEAEGAQAVRQLEGTVTVAVPAIGRMAERRIVPGFLRRLDIEAEELQRRLSGG